jgi:hypothetical protein
MPDAWYYTKGPTRQGPVTTDQLRALIAANQVVATDNVWREGMANWAPLATVPELAPPPPSAPPAYAPPPPPTFSPPPTYIPPTTGGPAAYSGVVVRYSAMPDPWGRTQKAFRVTLISCAAGVFLCFFTPFFFLTGLRECRFGWDLWWGILTFVFSIFALGSTITELSLRRIPLVRKILRWVHLGLFGGMTLPALIGMILGCFGIGVGLVGRTTGIYVIPITCILVLAAAATGLTLAILIVTRERA